MIYRFMVIASQVDFASQVGLSLRCLLCKKRGFWYLNTATVQ